MSFFLKPQIYATHLNCKHVKRQLFLISSRYFPLCSTTESWIMLYTEWVTRVIFGKNWKNEEKKKMRVWHIVTLKDLAKGFCRPAGYSERFGVYPATSLEGEVIKQGQCQCSHVTLTPQYDSPGVHRITGETKDYCRHSEICHQVLPLLLTALGYWASHNHSGSRF